MHQLILQICESRGLLMALALQLLINDSSPQMQMHRLILQNLRICGYSPRVWIVLSSSEIQSMQTTHVSRLTTHVRDRHVSTVMHIRYTGFKKKLLKKTKNPA